MKTTDAGNFTFVHFDILMVHTEFVSNLDIHIKIPPDRNNFLKLTPIFNITIQYFVVIAEIIILQEILENPQYNKKINARTTK